MITFTVIISCLYTYAYFSPKITLNSANALSLYDKENNLILQTSNNKKWANINEISNELINATISAGFGAMSGACESYFMSKSVDTDIRGIKTALKSTVKGNHPAVKKSAKKVVKSTMRKIAKEARIYGEDFVSTTAISWGTKEDTRRRVKYMVGA